VRRAQTVIEESVDELIDQLGSINARRRHDAFRALKQVGAGAVDPLVSRLTVECRARRHNSAKSFGLIAGAAVFYFWLMPRLTNPANWLLLLAFLPVTLIIMRLNAWSRLQIQAARLLSQIDDVRAVGPLADALESRDLWVVSSTRTLAAEALIRLLPHVTANDEALLNSSQRECLYRALDHAGLFDADLTSAVIQVMGRIGGESAVRPLQKLIGNRYFVGRHSELQTEAEAALEAIQARVIQTQAPEVLLRAAAQADEPGVLLRAVKPGLIDNPEQLLRSAGYDRPLQLSLQQTAEEADAVRANSQAKGITNSRGNVGIGAANTEVDSVVESRSESQ
jgi:HEAT repeat protein